MEEQDAADTLIPDLVSIPQIDGTDYFLIFDAKYYNIQLEKGKSLRNNPGVGDVTKQYLYQLAYRNFIKAHNIAVVKNCFLMPTEKDEIIKRVLQECQCWSPWPGEYSNPLNSGISYV